MKLIVVAVIERHTIWFVMLHSRFDLSPARGARLGAASAGLLGAIAGLAIGLHVHAATAWFAVVELAVPAAIAGSLVGVLLGWIATVAGD